MNAENLIISSLTKISEEIVEVRKEMKTQSKILNKLESSDLIQNNRCLLTHKILDEKVDSLINKKIKKEQIKSDWKIWIVRVIVMIPISVITTIIVLTIKGCI